jgi:DNA ligase-1
MKVKRPLLAEKITAEDLHKLRYPLLASPKFDGIRVRIDEKLRPMSRTNILIPNLHFQNIIKQHPHLAFLDGEVTAGTALSPDQFNDTQSSIMTRSGTPDFIYWVFDCFEHPGKPYDERAVDMLNKVYTNDGVDFIRTVEQIIMNSPEEVLAYEEGKINQGYEGIVLRSIKGRYKFGRSTLNEQILLKLKRFVDSEAMIAGVKALEHNNNSVTFDDLGYTKRSSHKDGMKTDELMGALEVKADGWLEEFSVGTGFTFAERQWFWQHRHEVIGRIITFKHQETGAKDKPRFTSYKGFRLD